MQTIPAHASSVAIQPAENAHRAAQGAHTPRKQPTANRGRKANSCATHTNDAAKEPKCRLTTVSLMALPARAHPAVLK